MKKAILYMRADPEGPFHHGQYLTLQCGILIDYCKKNEIEPVAFCEDRCNGIQIKSRVGFKGLLFDIDRKKISADLFLFTSYDVLATKMIDIWRLTDLLADYGIEAKNINDEDGFKVVMPKNKNAK